MTGISKKSRWENMTGSQKSINPLEADSERTNNKYDDDEGVDDDLAILESMDIDNDFNCWTSFRSSITQRAASGAKAEAKRLSSKASHTSSIPEEEGVVEEEDQEEGPSISLTQAELDDLAKWRKRLGREEVFSRYYMPLPLEAKEMKDLASFLGVDDPSDLNNSSSSGLSFMRSPPKNRAKRQVSASSAGSADAETSVIESLFFPNTYDPKSVLLKRGPVLLDGKEERELVLLTHGLIVATVDFNEIFKLLTAVRANMSDEQLKARFDAIDIDGSGELDADELKQLYKDLGRPVSDQTITNIMEQSDLDKSGTIDFDEFKAVAKREPAPPSSSPVSPVNPKGTEGTAIGPLGRLKRNISNTIWRKAMERKLECCLSLSSIDTVEDLSVCQDIAAMYEVPTWYTETAFAVTSVNAETGDPTTHVFVCATPEHRVAWVQALETAVVHAHMGGDAKVQRKIGWQHSLIRGSIFSAVISNDINLLVQILASGKGKDLDVNALDTYSGLTALHYAIVFDQIDCVQVLLQCGADVNALDQNGEAPISHAVRSKSEKAIEILEAHGADRSRAKGGDDSSGELFGEAAKQNSFKREQKRNAVPQSVSESAEKTSSKAKGVAGAMSEAMSAMKERGERLEKLDDKTAQLQKDAEEYKQMTKQLKEKLKKKSKFGF